MQASRPKRTRTGKEDKNRPFSVRWQRGNHVQTTDTEPAANLLLSDGGRWHQTKTTQSSLAHVVGQLLGVLLGEDVHDRAPIQILQQRGQRLVPALGVDWFDLFHSTQQRTHTIQQKKKSSVRPTSPRGVSDPPQRTWGGGTCVSRA